VDFRELPAIITVEVIVSKDFCFVLRKMSPENQGVFWLLKEVALRMLCYSFTASVFGSFARHSLAFSPLPQAS
jgi:hypothetical protein